LLQFFRGRDDGANLGWKGFLNGRRSRPDVLSQRIPPRHGDSAVFKKLDVSLRVAGLGSNAPKRIQSISFDGVVFEFVHRHATFSRPKWRDLSINLGVVEYLIFARILVSCAMASREAITPIAWTQAARLLALELYREDKVSLGRAAELCQTPVAAFMDFAAKHGVPPLRYSFEDLEEERQTADRLKA
jgi:predicted HTH domain antitoxin